jgi:hypothetical protein
VTSQTNCHMNVIIVLFYPINYVLLLYKHCIGWRANFFFSPLAETGRKKYLKELAAILLAKLSIKLFYLLYI